MTMNYDFSNYYHFNENEKIYQDGTVIAGFPGGAFLVQLDNEMDVLAVVSGRIRFEAIRIVAGDRVRVELPLYDLRKGRIILRHHSKRDDDDWDDFMLSPVRR
uniref:translation initiation factor 1 n=1 Tax=Athrotaxis cupressoides TaxID=99817 RepID=UPI001D1106A5|nr:translation initiation factor 1 [Athrotaxis cupressoides]QZN07955.1 translation initiation factor 1 [Athrotaxis cupressoides]